MTSVYLISEGEFGPVKVGVAARPLSRRAELQTGNPKPIYVYRTWTLFTRKEAFQVERLVLDEMAPYRLEGEWILADEFGTAAVVARHVEDVLMSEDDLTA